jgi:hypothetical protein
MPAQSTYTPIATTTLSATGDITFSSIPQTYTDLVLVLRGRSANAAINAGTYFGFNGTYGTGPYSSIELTGDTSAVTSAVQTNQPFIGGFAPVPAAGSAANIFGNIHYYILNYSNTTTNKTAIWKCAGDLAGSGRISVGAGLYRSTAAINAWFITTPGSFVAGTTATLYGITAA